MRSWIGNKVSSAASSVSSNLRNTAEYLYKNSPTIKNITRRSTSTTPTPQAQASYVPEVELEEPFSFTTPTPQAQASYVPEVELEEPFSFTTTCKELNTIFKNNYDHTEYGDANADAYHLIQPEIAHLCRVKINGKVAEYLTICIKGDSTKEFAPQTLQFSPVLNDTDEIAFHDAETYDKIKECVELVAKCTTLQKLKEYCRNKNITKLDLTFPSYDYILLKSQYFHEYNDGTGKFDKALVKSIDFDKDTIVINNAHPYSVYQELQLDDENAVYLGVPNMHLEQESYKHVWTIFIKRPMELLEKLYSPELLGPAKGGKRRRSRRTRRKSHKSRKSSTRRKRRSRRY
jgi:hypothetical protein